MTESSSSSSYSPSSTVPRKPLTDLFRPRIIDSSRVLLDVFGHLVHNWTLFLASCYCSFLVHVVANLICIWLVSRQLVLLSPHVKFLHSICGQKVCVWKISSRMTSVFFYPFAWDSKFFSVENNWESQCIIYFGFDDFWIQIVLKLFKIPSIWTNKLPV